MVGMCNASMSLDDGPYRKPDDAYASSVDARTEADDQRDTRMHYEVPPSARSLSFRVNSRPDSGLDPTL